MTNFVDKKLMQSPRSISWPANQKQLFSFIGPFLYLFCILMIGSNSISNYLEFVSIYWGRLFVCLFLFCHMEISQTMAIIPHHWLLCCWKALNEGAPRWVLQCIDQSKYKSYWVLNNFAIENSIESKCHGRCNLGILGKPSIMSRELHGCDFVSLRHKVWEILKK
jgi:hypothetical protein